MIPYGRQHVTDSDCEAVLAVLRSDWLTQGPAVPRFEEAVASYCGISHAVALNSATSALHAACSSLGLGPGGLLWTSPITFVASANCALYCGADVDFVDIDPQTYNMSVAALETKLAQAERNGRLPDIVVPVHFAGQSCDMEDISRLGKRYGFRIIEDASHAVGGRYQGQPVGNCRYSDITIFSFHPVKIITTAEGGMALTNDAELAEKMRRFRSHGITRDPAFMDGASEGDWYYQQIELGYNYRLTDIQAALGLSQLERLDANIERRHQLAKRYDALLADVPVVVPRQAEDRLSALHLYPVLLDSSRTRKTRLETFDYMRSHGVGVNVHYIPVHLQPYYRRLGFAPGDFPEAERYYESTMTLPLFATLADAEQDKVVEALREAFAL